MAILPYVKFRKLQLEFVTLVISMSEQHLRVSSPPSASPGRVSRPHWPWATYTSQTPIHSPMNPSTHSGASLNHWDTRSSTSSATHATTMPWSSNHLPRHNTVSSMLFSNATNEETTRHWTYNVSHQFCWGNCILLVPGF